MQQFIPPKNVAIHTGFPNPATDQSLQGLDLNQLLIAHPISTYFMRIEGSSWQSLGIFNGDIAMVDRAITPSGNDLVIWWQADSFALSHAHSVPKNVPIWGVVTSTIHQFKRLSHGAS